MDKIVQTMDKAIGKLKKVNQKEYTDHSIMPYGEHKGKKLKDVPDQFLLDLYESEADIIKTLKMHGLTELIKLYEYIEHNIDVFKHNIKQNQLNYKQ